MAAEMAVPERARRVALPHGALVCDPSRVIDPDARLFDPSAWSAAGDESERGGRGAVWFVQGEFGAGPLNAVLRHYRRGGAMARLFGDRYIWTGEAHTRPFREFELLAALHRRGLPVPRPLAAGYRRNGLIYRGDILTEQVRDSRTLAQCLPEALDDLPLWTRIGHMLGAFQRAGAFHADLNAHNILIDTSGKTWLIDFDRGRLMRRAASWQDANLARLKRSLSKLGADVRDGFDEAWRALWRACADARA